ncbi:infB, partial [Ophiophagus hannah]
VLHCSNFILSVQVSFPFPRAPLFRTSPRVREKAPVCGASALLGSTRNWPRRGVGCVSLGSAVLPPRLPPEGGPRLVEAGPFPGPPAGGSLPGKDHQAAFSVNWGRGGFAGLLG